MRTQQLGRLLARLLLVAFIALPMLPAQLALAAPAVQTDEQIANRVADIRNGTPDVADDFEADDEVWGVLYSGVSSIYFKSGRLHISTDATDQIVWSNREGTSQDLYLEVEAEHYLGPDNYEAGVIFRYVDDDNFYYFGIDGFGNYIVQAMYEGEWYNLIDWTRSSVIERGVGSRNLLGVLAEGSSISVLVNDYVLTTVEDETFTEGRVGLAAVSYDEPGLDIAFDNFNLWDLGEPRNGLPVRVPQQPSSGTPEPEATPTGPATPDTTPTPTPIVAENSVSAIRSQEPSYVEDFSQEPGGWIPLQADGLDYAVQNGRLSISVDSANALGWTILPVAPNNYYLEVDTTFRGNVSEAEFGILFRYQDPENFNLFAVNNTGYYSLWRLVDNQWEALADWQETDTLEQGNRANNRLGLLVEDDMYTVFINDIEVMTVQDALFAGGSLALALGTFSEPGVTVTFDDLTIWSLDPESASTGRPQATTTPPEEPTAPAPEESWRTDIEAEIAALVMRQEGRMTDDFSADFGLWELAESEESSIVFVDETLQIQLDTTYWYQWSGFNLPGDETLPANYYAEVITFFPADVADATAGIVFRAVSDDQYYIVLMTADGQYSFRMRDGDEWREITNWQDSSAIDTAGDARNRLGVLVEGDTFALVINGRVVELYQDENYAEGGLGLLGMAGSEAGVRVSFDDFALWALDESSDILPAELPEVTDPLELEPLPTEEPTLPSPDELEEQIAAVVDGQAVDAQDDFNRDRGNWLLRANDNSRVVITDNALEIEIDESNWYQWSSYTGGGEEPLELTDLYAEVTTFFPQPQPGAATGIAFRLLDVDNYYLFIVTTAGRYALFVQVDGEWSTLVDYTQSDTFDTAADAFNTIGVLADGDILALTINQQVVEVVQDATLSSGSLALVGETGSEPGAVVAFDDFMLWQLE